MSLMKWCLVGTVQNTEFKRGVEVSKKNVLSHGMYLIDMSFGQHEHYRQRELVRS